MPIRSIVTVLALLFISASAFASDFVFQEHTYTARVGDVRLQSQLVEQGKSNDDTVQVTAPTYFFDPPVRMDDVRSADTAYAKEVLFLMDYIKANIAGDAEKILTFWLPEERQGIAKMLNDPKMLAQNTAYFKRNPGLEVLGIIYQGKTRAFLQKRGSMVVGVNYVQKGGEYFLTNKPADDLELAIIEASFN